MKKLRVVILKPSKYDELGFVQRFMRGFMPNTTVPYLAGMTPERFHDCLIEKYTIDEYVQTDLRYLELLRGDAPTLLALVGVQSHQFHRALDLAAYARRNGVHTVIGGPHPMTCDTSMLQNRGVSFALSEAELIWPRILQDAVSGELQPVYGQEQRWQTKLEPPVMNPLSRSDMKHYVIPFLGVYPARGCPYTCNFCSVIKIAGRQVRSQGVDVTMETLRLAKRSGVRFIFFTSDNFNKYADAPELLERMTRERIDLPFMIQCDTQIAKQEKFVELLGRAGCFQMFVGVESLNRRTLLKAHKAQNHPDKYKEIVGLTRKHGFSCHFSNIIGFPDDTEETIKTHIAEIVRLGPGAVSAYILTPIPGTEQYDDFMAQGLVSEKNLDRFDGTCPTWRHPHLKHEKLTELMFEFYRTFYSDTHLLHSLSSGNRNMGWYSDKIARCIPLFHRYAVWQRFHPMSGGLWRVQKDGVSDYLPLRRELFGYELVPLPESLVLSDADAKLNQQVKLEQMVV